MIRGSSVISGLCCASMEVARNVNRTEVNVSRLVKFPSFEEGWPRRSNKCIATSNNRRGRGGQTRDSARQSDHLLMVSPYRAHIRSAHARLRHLKVALH